MADQIDVHTMNDDHQQSGKSRAMVCITWVHSLTPWIQWVRMIVNQSVLAAPSADPAGGSGLGVRGRFGGARLAAGTAIHGTITGSSHRHQFDPW